MQSFSIPVRLSGVALSFGVSLSFVILLTAGPAPADDIKVTVVSVLATTEENAPVDKDLVALADAVKLNFPGANFTGFRKGRTSCMKVPVGQTETFPLDDEETATVTVVTVLQGKDKKEMVKLKVKPPTLNELTMNCCYGKFVPFVTNYDTREKKERLIIAVMVSTCPCK